MTPSMTPRQKNILAHLTAVPGRIAYRVGSSPNTQNLGRWTASYPQPRVWFAEQDIVELRQQGKLVTWHGHDDALVLAQGEETQ